MQAPTLVVISDPLRHVVDTPEMHFDLIREPILQGCAIEIGHPPGGTQPHGLKNSFDLEHFRTLASVEGLGREALWHHSFSTLQSQARDYFLAHLPRPCVLLMFEAPAWLIKLCEAERIPYIDLRVSPLRFARDLYCAMRTSQPAYFARIGQHAVIEEELRLEASQLGANLRYHALRLANSGRYDLHLGRSLVYVGQAPYDASILNDEGRSLHMADYAERIAAFAKGRSVYYKPHPLAMQLAETEREELQAIVGLPVKLCHHNAYQLLTLPCDVELIGVSSGLLQEARWFGKKAHVLFRPFVPLVGEQGLPNEQYQQLHYQTLSMPGFWHRLLTPWQAVPRLDRLPSLSRNDSREALNTWWDYSKVMSWERALPIESFERSGGGLLRTRIEALEEAVFVPMSTPECE